MTAAPTPPPALNSTAYAQAFKQILQLGGDGVNSPTQRTVDQTLVGVFWGYDGSPGIGVPPRLYNQIVEVIAGQMHNSEVQNARLFALVNILLKNSGVTPI